MVVGSNTTQLWVQIPNNRVSRTCSCEKDYKKNTMEMKSWFLKRGYPKSLVEKELGKVKFSNKVANKQQKERGIPFVVTYHLIL